MQESGYNTIKIQNMQLIVAPKCVHNLESTLKEKSILKKIELLDQPVTACPTQLVRGVSHKKIVLLLV